MKGRSSEIFLWLAISIENNDVLLTHINVVFRTVIAHFFMYYAMIKHRYLHFIKSPELNIPWCDFLHHLCHRFAWVAIFKLLQSYSCLFMRDVGNIDVFPWIPTSSSRPISFFKDFVLDKRPRNNRRPSFNVHLRARFYYVVRLWTPAQVCPQLMTKIPNNSMTPVP